MLCKGNCEFCQIILPWDVQIPWKFLVWVFISKDLIHLSRSFLHISGWPQCLKPNNSIWRFPTGAFLWMYNHISFDVCYFLISSVFRFQVHSLHCTSVILILYMCVCVFCPSCSSKGLTSDHTAVGESLEVTAWHYGTR